MNKKYYSVIAIDNVNPGYSIQFGDYEQSVAMAEAIDMDQSGEWVKVKVIKTDDNQKAIEMECARVNEELMKEALIKDAANKGHAITNPFWGYPY